jgi:hypothetical protein
MLNGHGGNDPARARLAELANDLPELLNLVFVVDFAQRRGGGHEARLKSSHASWIEASPSRG